jgi:hypothetical protein
MAHYEAVVTGLLPNGKAEILVQPDRTGDPNAPACHCGANKTMFRIEALNRADALVGDWVSVSRDSSHIMRNIGFLIGIPLAGLITGAALGNLWGGAALAISCLAGTLLGIVIGIPAYRRLSKNNLPVIERVIQSRKELTAMYTGRPNAGKDQVGCQEGCTSCFP